MNISDNSITWQCSSCKLKNKMDCLECVACFQKAPTASEEFQSLQMAANQKIKSFQWTYSLCTLQNKNESLMCIACNALMLPLVPLLPLVSLSSLLLPIPNLNVKMDHQKVPQTTVPLPVPTNNHTKPAIYVLLLENNYIYIGRVESIKRMPARFREHKEGKNQGAIWTKIHPPVKILRVKLEKSPSDEDDQTMEFMANPMYGIDRVRGGSFLSLNIDQHRPTISKMIASRLKLCYSCHLPGHLASSCFTRSFSSSVQTPQT
jgi:hypothetical protein